MPTDLEWSVVFAGGAAAFSLLSVIVGRLNYADDELSRQNRIENRVLNRERSLTYERPPRPRSSGFGIAREGSLLPDEEPEYIFRVDDVLVSEKRGWRYLIDKVVHGFDGYVSIVIVSKRWKSLIGTWSPETPPDFEQIKEFGFEGRNMTYELRKEENRVVLRFQKADVDRVSVAIDDFLDHIERKLASELMDWETEP